MDSWWVAFSRCGKFLLSVITPKVFKLERRSFAQIEAYEKTISECINLFNFLQQKLKLDEMAPLLHHDSFSVLILSEN